MKRRDIEDLYRLTPLQEGMLVETLEAPGSGAYVLQLSCLLEGDLDPAALRRAWERTVARHTVLRTSFHWREAEHPLQVVHRQVGLPWSEEDWRPLPPEEQEERFAARLDEERRRGFELDRPPLLALSLVRCGERSWRFLWSCHHLLLDGWSQPLVLRDVFTLYEGLVRGEEPGLPPPRPFRAYIEWLQKRSSEPSQAFWQREMAGFAESTPLTFGGPPPASPPSPAEHLERRDRALTPEATAALEALARERRLTLAHLVEAAWALLLGRTSGRGDVLFGTVVSGRPPQLPGVETMVGPFIHTVPLRLPLAPQEPLASWLGEVGRRARGVLEHGTVPLAQIHGWSDVPRNQPLYESLLVFESYPVDAALVEDAGGLAVRDVQAREGSLDPLVLLAVPGERLGLTLAYDRRRFEGGEIDALLARLGGLLEAMPRETATAGGRTLCLEDLPLLDAEERREVLAAGRGEELTAPPTSLWQRFAAQARRQPEAPALRWRRGGRGLGWSYGELAGRAQALAEALGGAGAGPEGLVAVSLEDPGEMVVAFLACLALGAAYLPLDPSLPPDRRVWMLGDAAASTTAPSGGPPTPPPLLVTDPGEHPWSGGELPPGLAVIHPPGSPPAETAAERALEGRPAPPDGATAYLLYTSGSTGVPKAVAVPHGAFAAHVEATCRALSLRPGERLLCHHPVGFDVAVEQTAAALAAGACLLPRSTTPQAPGELLARLGEEGVTVAGFPTALWRLLAAEADARGIDLAAGGLRRVVVGGEAMETLAARRWLRAAGREVRLVNAYGPTEAVVTATLHEVDDVRVEELPGTSPKMPDTTRKVSDTVPIGRPLPGRVAWVVDGWGDLAPPGVAGELLLGGLLARSYAGRPAATAERFVPDPFSGAAGARLYRTGDRVRRLPAGELEFLGRLDSQLKIRGYRVEPGEIEAALGEHPAVRQTAVVAPEGRLTAWVAVDLEGEGGEGETSSSELDAWLRRRLPAWMVPAVIRLRSELPRTARGKLDRRRLAAEASELDAVATAAAPRPSTPAEELVAGVWAEVLGRPRVGRTESFFDLGGHSLSAMRAVSRLRETCGVELPLALLFEHPTPRALAPRLEEALSGERPPAPPPLEPVPWEGDMVAEIPLSFAQERLWFLAQLDPGGTAYHIPGALDLNGRLVLPRLAAVLGEIVRRHEALRTTFPAPGGRPRQEIVPPGSLHGSTTVLSAPPATGRPDAVRTERKPNPQGARSASEHRPQRHPAGPTEVGAASMPAVGVPPLPVVDLSGLPAPVAEGRAEELAEAVARRPFDLERGPLLRVVLLRLGEREHRLLWTVHHIVSDGWSQGVLLGEMEALDRAFAAGAPSPLPELPVQYVDYAIWQRRWLTGDALEARLAAWRETLAGAPPVLELPTDRPRPAALSQRGGRVPVALGAGISDRLEGLARQRGATLFMTLLAVLAVQLHRYGAGDDLLLGSPAANRGPAATEGLIGFFVNTLPLRLDLAGDPTFGELLTRVRRVCLEAFARQDLPFEKLVELLGPERSLAHAPLLQVMLVLHDRPPAVPELPGLVCEPRPVETGTAKLDLLLELARGEAGIAGALEHSADLFDPTTARRMAGHFRVLAEAVAADPERRLSELPLLGAAERRQLLEWAGPRAEFPAPSCLHELFLARARERPEAVAVRRGEVSLTYGELARRAAALARRLTDAGVGPEEPVALAAGRSEELIAGMLGILMAGAAYLPLDPAWPAERAALLLEDAGVRQAVADGPGTRLLEEVETAGGPAPLRLAPGDVAEAAPAAIRECPGGPESLAYILYTSGSTGRPKPAAVTHAHVARLLAATEDWLTPGPEDVWTLFHSPAFDFSVWEIWGALAHGGRLVVVPWEVTRSPAAFLELLARERVTVLNQTPSAFAQLTRAAEEAGGPAAAGLALRTVIFGGEALEVGLLAPWMEMPAAARPRLVNMYGITETTVHVTRRNLAPADLVDSAASPGTSPIGRALPDLSTHVLDPAGSPVPVGVPGELHVGGAGVCRGYPGRPALTAERFVPDPFSGVPGARLYKSGDRVRWRASGELAYLGRLDHQVKLRGFRIEPGEVEAALAAHEAVEEAAVVLRQLAGGPALVAYVVARGGEEPAAGDLLAFLRRRLPEPLVPGRFVFLAALPLTPNGKVDRRALPLPEGARPELQRAYVAPRDGLERVLAQGWAEALGVDRVGVEDSFFDLGGHSLLATQVISWVRDTFEVELPLRALFERPTVAGLAAVLRAQGDDRQRVEETAELLLEVAELSDGEVRERLEEAPEV